MNSICKSKKIFLFFFSMTVLIGAAYYSGVRQGSGKHLKNASNLATQTQQEEKTSSLPSYAKAKKILSDTGLVAKENQKVESLKPSSKKIIIKKSKISLVPAN